MKEESKTKQPVGMRTDSKKKTNPQKLLIVADEKASFFNLARDNNSQSTLLEEDASYPNFPLAKVARFAPLSGQQAAIVDELGIHLVDMSLGKETLFIAINGVEALKYSPADSYIITCEQYVQNVGTNKNLSIWCAKTGKTLAQFEWKKSPQESMKSIIFTPDEKLCLRLVPYLGSQKGPNQIEIYADGKFDEPKICIKARFQQKAPVKGDPPIMVNSKFDGFELCPLNPQVPAE